MYDNDVMEQLIMEVIGHHSDSVRIYKRTSEKLREEASSTVSKVGMVCKKPKLEKSDAKDDVKSEGNCQCKK